VEFVLIWLSTSKSSW